MPGRPLKQPAGALIFSLRTPNKTCHAEERSSATTPHLMFEAGEHLVFTLKKTETLTCAPRHQRPGLVCSCATSAGASVAALRVTYSGSGFVKHSTWVLISGRVLALFRRRSPARDRNGQVFTKGSHNVSCCP